MIRALVKLALTYAVTKTLARAGGPGGLINSVLKPKGKRGARGPARSTGRRGH